MSAGSAGAENGAEIAHLQGCERWAMGWCDPPGPFALVFFSVALKRPPESALGLLLYDPKPDIIEKILEVYIHHSDPT